MIKKEISKALTDNTKPKKIVKLKDKKNKKKNKRKEKLLRLFSVLHDRLNALKEKRNQVINAEEKEDEKEEEKKPKIKRRRSFDDFQSISTRKPEIKPKETTETINLGEKEETASRSEIIPPQELEQMKKGLTITEPFDVQKLTKIMNESVDIQQKLNKYISKRESEKDLIESIKSIKSLLTHNKFNLKES